MEAVGIPSLRPHPPSKKRKLSDLKEDELVEILVRLPLLESVFRCKCVSKNWLALISDPLFIRSYINRRKKKKQRDQFIAYHVIAMWRPKLDVYGHLPVRFPDDDDNDDDEDEVDEYPISDRGGKYLNFSYSFIPDFKRNRERDLPRCFEMVRISHGLVLCKGQVRPPGLAPTDAGSYYVCNPLTKQWLEIPTAGHHPPPPGFDPGQVGFMCYPRAPDTPHEVDFLVLEVQSKEDKDDNDNNNDNDNHFFWARVFSSHTGCWTNYRVASPPGVGSSWSQGGSSSKDSTYNYGEVVVYRGMFHWRGGSHLISYI